jgi:hypothetical protein
LITILFKKKSSLHFFAQVQNVEPQNAEIRMTSEC